MKKIMLVGITTFMMIQLSQADLLVGTFQNMDFETRIVRPNDTSPTDSVTLANFPWKFGTAFVYNNMWLLTSAEQYVFHTAFNGTISMNMSVSPTATISQTGLIPVEANSVQFEYGGLLPTLHIDGNQVDLIEDTQGILKGDISPWSGQTVELSIKAENYVFYDGVNVDNVGFSTEVIPEPSTTTLLGVAAVALSILRSKKKYFIK